MSGQGIAEMAVLTTEIRAPLTNDDWHGEARLRPSYADDTVRLTISQEDGAQERHETFALDLAGVDALMRLLADGRRLLLLAQDTGARQAAPRRVQGGAA